MPSPKSGSPGSPAPPTAPGDPKAPVNAAAGQVSTASANPGQSAPSNAPSVPVTPFKPTTKQEAKEQGKKLHFIEIKLIDQDKDPVPNEPFRIEMPDGSVATGTLNAKGVARIDGIPDTGTCKVSFPGRDKSTWDKK